MKVTAKEIMDLNPCEDYTLEKVKNLMGELKSVSAIDILDTNKIPDKDKIWLVLHEELLPELLLHQVGIFCAELVLPIWEKEFPEDNRPRLVIEPKKLWFDGKIDNKELEAVWEAAKEKINEKIINFIRRKLNE